MNNSDMPAMPKCKPASEGRMTKREQFCLQMGVPETGDPELDDIIRKGNRNKAAMVAMQGILSNSGVIGIGSFGYSEVIAKNAVFYADNLLSELAKAPT